MSDFEVFKEHLRQALQHINHPDFEPGSALCQALGCDPREGCAPVQAVIVSAIADLEPDKSLPPDTVAGRAFESLQKRYVVGLTQEETAEYLHMSRRNLQRIQAEAIHILARNLWGQRQISHRGSTINQSLDEMRQDAVATGESSSDWRSQTDLELASLTQCAPEAIAPLDTVIDGVLKLTNILASQHGVEITQGFIQTGLEAAIHPSALRQTLITAIGRLLPRVTGALTLYAALQDARIKITLTGLEKADHALKDSDLIQGIITPSGTTVEVEHDAGHVFLVIRVPSAEEYTIVVVEDNEDMVGFYRRCTSGTAYRILRAAPEADVTQQIIEMAPDIIILDVMLPNVDGWQLLTLLHENMETRAIPVIVSSVVREEDLALALGAARFLSKPVQPRLFVETLNQVLHQATVVRAKSQLSSGEAC